MSIVPILGEPEKRVFSTYDLEWTPGHSPEKSAALGLDPLQVRVVGCFDGQRYTPFRTLGEFVEAQLRPENHGRWYFAHAGGLYDIQFVFEWLIKNALEEYEVNAAMVGSSAIIVRVSRGRHHWTFLDSYWLMRAPLRKIAKWIGQEKGGAEGDTSTFWAPIGELIDYNERDCRILWHAVAHFEHVIMSLGGQLEKTVASTALSLFRRAYLKREIQTSARLNEIARQAYIASRVEVFEPVATLANSWDINSSFPYAMTFPVPGNSVGESRRLPGKGLYLADVTVEVPPCHIPVLPVRGPHDGRIYFPTGRWRHWYCSTDIEFLQESGGHVRQVHRAISFESFDDMAEYANDLYDRRAASKDDGYKVILKFLLNSLYGKFAEAGRKSRIVFNPGPKLLALPDWVPGGTGKKLIRPGVWEIVEDKPIAHAHVPIAVQITAFARRTLGRYLLDAPRVYYCDTDSLVVPATHTYPVSDKLGGLKLEKPMLAAHFQGPKLYAWRESIEKDWSVKAKGFSKVHTPGGDNRSFNGDDYWRLVAGGAVELGGFARVRQTLGNSDPAPSEIVTRKSLRGTMRPKRCPCSDGTTTPWDIRELDRPWRAEETEA